MEDSANKQFAASDTAVEEDFREVEFLESENDREAIADDPTFDSEPISPGLLNISLPSNFEDNEADNRSTGSNPLHNSSSGSTRASARATAPTDENGPNNGERMCIKVNISAAEYKKYQFHFVGVFFFARSFRTQHLMDPVYKQNVCGRTIAELQQNIWEHSIAFISREVLVEHNEAEKSVRWTSKQTPDMSDMTKFILFKHGKTKKLYTFDDLKESTKLLSKWRGSEVQIHIFKYSVAVATHTLYDMINKKLLHPEQKDKTGAPANHEIFSCINQLKATHSQYTAMYASWEKWANYICAQPGDMRPKLIKKAPPDEYLHLFRAVPLSEGEQLRVTRQGLQVAYNITDSVSSSIDTLCERIDTIASSISDVRVHIHELKAQVKTSRSLLEAMEASLPPEETEFSMKLASNVVDIDDVDHQE